MSRIDAQLATQVAEVSRPQQNAQEQQLQFAAARDRAVTQSGDEALGVASDAPTAEEIRSTVAHVKQVIEAASSHQLSFKLDDTGKDLVVQVVDRKGETIRQIPSREVLDLRRRIDALVGALINTKA
jgi:flagellar protein FlaG